MDQKVLEAQQWYNTTYEGTNGYVRIDEDGITGAGTCRALVRALQYELGLIVDGSFGNGTLAACPTIGTETSSKNLVKIVQCGFYCKGYDCGGIDGVYGFGTQTATIFFKNDAGFPNEDDSLQPVFIKALLNTDAFNLVRTGKIYIRQAQQYLNANYVIKTNIIGLIPCNGVADRNMTKAIICALQYEEAGKTMSGVDGIYGNNTLNRAPELSIGSDKTDYIRIAQMCLMVMYESNPGISGNFDSNMESVVKSFQEFHCLTQDSRVIPGIIGRITWASLLSSKGDNTRIATACDCSEQILSTAKAQKLRENYVIVGRYLTGTVGGSKPKSLSMAELQILAENDLRVFPIYQDGGAALTYFNENQGTVDAGKAILAAQKLHIPNGTIIYFAVDYDFTEEQALERVIPYFQGINSIFNESTSRYKIGIYGSRNICSIIGINNLSTSSFISDMSTGYSGNMGFPLPSDWAFDQIYEYEIIASDGTTFAVDKDVCSGRDMGFKWNELCGGDAYQDCTQHSMVLLGDGYYECLSCGYKVPSPYLEDNEILSADDHLKIRALEALYSISVGDDRYRNLLYTICCKMQEVRNSSEYIGRYAYQDAAGKCILIPPEGDYNNNFFNSFIHDPATVTSMNIIKYNGVFEILVDVIYGIAVDHKYSLTITETIAELLENPNIPITMNEILKALAEKAGLKEWGYILELLQIGVEISEAEANAKAVIGDIVVTFTYDLGGSISLLGDAQVIFDANRNLKSVAY